MGIEKITSKILEEAEADRKAYIGEAQDKVKVIMAEAEDKADKLLDVEKQRGAELKDRTISRSKSVADIECRKIILQKKQEIIESCFEKAVETFANMEKDDYETFLLSLIKSTGEASGKLIFNEKDRASIGNSICQKFNKVVENGHFELAEETKNIKGGFILQAGNVYINNSVEALVTENKDLLTNKVAAMMFE